MRKAHLLKGGIKPVWPAHLSDFEAAVLLWLDGSDGELWDKQVRKCIRNPFLKPRKQNLGRICESFEFATEWGLLAHAIRNTFKILSQFCPGNWSSEMNYLLFASEWELML